LQKLWTTSVHVLIAIATEVIQLPCSGQQAFFINIEVWLVTFTDESEASNRKHVSLSFVVVKEKHNLHSLLHYALLYVGTGIAMAGQTMARLFS